MLPYCAILWCSWKIASKITIFYDIPLTERLGPSKRFLWSNQKKITHEPSGHNFIAALCFALAGVLLYLTCSGSICVMVGHWGAPEITREPSGRTLFDLCEDARCSVTFGMKGFLSRVFLSFPSPLIKAIPSERLRQYYHPIILFMIPIAFALNEHICLHISHSFCSKWTHLHGDQS